MAIVGLVFCLLLQGLVVMPLPAREQSYQALSVQNVGSKSPVSSGGFLEVAFALLPEIEEVVKNVTKNAPSASVREARRFREIMEVFIPFVRKAVEFDAEEKGRTLSPEDLEMLDVLELGLSYIGSLAETNLSSDSNDAIPDYTHLLDIPDINIPSINIPETIIPSINVPRIDVPGGLHIREKEISFQNIPEIAIPGRSIPVTSAPRQITEKPEVFMTHAVTEKSFGVKLTTQPPVTPAPDAKSPTPQTPSTDKINDTSRKRVPPSQILRAEHPKLPYTLHALPGGGYSYSYSKQ